MVFSVITRCPQCPNRSIIEDNVIATTYDTAVTGILKTYVTVAVTGDVDITGDTSATEILNHIIMTLLE